MLKTAAVAVLAAAFALTIHSPLAVAGDRDRITRGEGWDLALYGTDSDSAGSLPAGGIALSMHANDGWPAATLSIDYADNDAPMTMGSGLGLLASVDLVEADSRVLGAQPFLRLSYRLAPGFSPTGGGDEGQLIAVRTGLRW
jgi:hypothetical protein